MAEKCEMYRLNHNDEGYCLGTKEMDLVSCGGNECKCVVSSKRRNAAVKIEENAATAVNEDCLPDPIICPHCLAFLPVTWCYAPNYSSSFYDYSKIGFIHCPRCGEELSTK